CAENHTGPPGAVSAHTSCAPRFGGSGYSWTVTCAAAEAQTSRPENKAALSMTRDPRSKRPRDPSTAALDRVAGDAQPRRAHVVAAQLAQRVADEARDDFLPPVDVEVRVVERLRARGDLRPRFGDDLVGKPRADEDLPAFGDDRPRGDRAEHDPR